MMRKAQRCVWVLLTFAFLCAIYFLLVIHGEHGTWSELDTHSRVRHVADNSTSNQKGTNVHKCRPDPQFAASINNSNYGHPVLRKDIKCIYVSVPKCGSRTLVWISWELKAKNDIKTIADLPYLLADKPESEMRSVVRDSLLSVPDGSLIHGHLRFIQFSGDKVPVLLSMLRDPLSRHVSWYYFMRFGDADMDAEKLQAAIAREGKDAVNQTYDECVQKKRFSCSDPYYTNINIRMFCGYSEKCIKSPEYALEQAKRNVDQFLFVGIMEEYEDTLRVMERLLPSMFDGAVNEYHKSKEKFSAASKTTFKKPPEPETVAIMKEKMKLDYEFYDYVRERFHKLRRHLGIGPC